MCKVAFSSRVSEGMIIDIAPDFDEPLDDMKEYME
jgi:hypothetical protein